MPVKTARPVEVPAGVLNWGGIGARILIVGEAPGRDEAAIGAPFVGASGRLLARLLMESGILPYTRLPYPAPFRPGSGQTRTAWAEAERLRCGSIMRDFWRDQPVYLTNVCPFRPPDNDLSRFTLSTAAAKRAGLEPTRGLFLGPQLTSGLDALADLVTAREWDLIITCGSWPLWALTEDAWSISNRKGYKVPAGVGTWRGSQLESRATLGATKLVPIYHPAAILRNYAWYNITLHDLRARAAQGARSRTPWSEPDYEFTIRPSFEAVMHWLDEMAACLQTRPQWSAWDLETRNGHIACCGIATSETRAICIPFMDVHKPEGYWDAGSERAIINALRALLRHPNLRLVGQNFLYDSQYIAADWFCVPYTTQDTMLDQHVLFAGLPKGLDFLASMYCKFYRYWKAEGKLWNPARHGEERGWIYNCRDAVNTFEVGAVLSKAIERGGLEGPRAFQMRLFPVVLRMMLRGARVDLRRRSALSLDLLVASQQFEAAFRTMIDPSWIPVGPSTKSEWFRSNKQQMTLFYDVLGIPPVMKRTKEGSRPTVDDAALEVIALREPLVRHICNALARYRKLENSQSVLESKVDGDLRMRTSYNIGGAETYRFSSSENAFGRGTNLQNITSGED